MKNKMLCMLLGLLVIFGFGIFLKSMDPLKQETFVFEYGQPVKVKEEDLFKGKVPKDWKLELTIQNEKGKPYPAVGTYDGQVSFSSFFKKKNKPIQVEVKDTKNPEFSKFSETVIVDPDTSNHDYAKDFIAKDFSDVSLSFDLKKVEKKEGTYPAKVKAVDAYGNKTVESFEVIVEEKKEETESSTSDLSYVDGILVVNKKHGLPIDYAPGEDPEAVAHLQKLIADMQAQGLSISNSYSGFRSYSYQESLYNQYLASNGQESADTFSARPGYSEHQTGLAFDLIQPNGALLESKPEADWIEANAHRYGFIVRYPLGKESITGYMAEPWHLRYIGEKASDIYASGLTLEEYLGVSGGISY